LGGGEGDIFRRCRLWWLNLGTAIEAERESTDWHAASQSSEINTYA
jgi:hypothetical protein